MIDMMILAVNDNQKFRKKMNILYTSIPSNYLLIDPSLLFFLSISRWVSEMCFKNKIKHRNVNYKIGITCIQDVIYAV